MSDFAFTFGPSSSARRVEERPFALGVMADLSGSPAEPLEAVAARGFLAIDVDNFEARMRAARPRVAFAVPNAVTGEGTVAVDLTFAELEDFGPGVVASKVELLATLRDARARLVALRSTGTQGAAGVRELLSGVLSDPVLVDALAGPAPAPEPAAPEPEATPEAGGSSDLERLLGQKMGAGPQRPASALQGIFDQAAAGTPQVSDQAAQAIDLLRDKLDSVMARQLDAILHHADFLALEGTWRGLNFLLENADTDDGLSIRVLNASKAELAALLDAGAMLGGSALASRLRGEPYGVLVCDYYFDHSAEDVALLRALGEAAATLGLPLVAGAAPSLFGLATWRALPATLDSFQRLAGEAYAGWRELVESPVASRLLLAMPRFLARLPYGRKTNPAEGLAAYEETAPVGDPSSFAWSNAAWAMAAVIASAVSIDGWDATITAGGEDCQVGGLPCHTFTNRDGDSEMMCPTELPMTVEFGVLLAKVGLAPLLHLKNTDRAVFVRVPSLGGRG